MIPTINDYPSNSIYTDEQRKIEIYEKYFARVDKNMCVNEGMIKIQRNYFAVAEIAAKTFLSYVTIDCDKKISEIYELLNPTRINRN